MKNLLAAIIVAPMITACVGTAERPMNFGESTIVSDQVAKMVNESETGAIDIRDHEDIRCERIRITGTHMLKRHCYTLAEKEASDKANQDAMRDEFGKVKCLDTTIGGACHGN